MTLLRRNGLACLLAFVAIFSSSRAHGAMFMKFSGMTGGSVDPSHVGWSDISNLSLRMSHPANSAVTLLDEARFAMPIDRSYPALFTALNSVDMFPSLIFEQVNAGVLALKHDFRDVTVNSLVTSFDSAGSANLVGSFTAERLTITFYIPGGGTTTSSYDFNSSGGGSVVIPAPAAQGDYNGDGLTTGHDLLAWQRTLGRSDLPLAGADGDGSGTIDAADIAVWKQNFASASSTLSPVPEPETLAMIVVSISMPALIRVPRRAR